MQGEKGEKRKYAEDKPDCAYCYFRKKKGVCRLKECYYLLPEKPEKKEEETCADCPYGKPSLYRLLPFKDCPGTECESIGQEGRKIYAGRGK